MFSADFPRCCPDSLLGFAVMDEDASTLTVAVRGEIDMDNADHLLHVLCAALREAPSCLAVDLSEVAFLGSAGIQAFIDGRAEAVNTGRRLVLVGPRAVTRRVLEITGLLELFGLQPPAITVVAH